MIFTALGWLAVLGLLAVTASCAWHGWRAKFYGPWVSFSLYACGLFTLLGIDGILRTAVAGVFAMVAATATAVLLIPEGKVDELADWDWRRALGALPARVAAGPGYLYRDVLALLHRGDPEPELSSPEAAVAEAVATRGIPSVMADPALGVAPEPADLANPAVPVPSPWAALAEYIRSREPSDDGELRMFTEGDAAGALAVADARHAFADTCLNSLGLNPAYVAGVMETGDSMAEHATMLAQVHKRYQVIYGAVTEWVAAHGPLPHKARDFLTGGM